MIRRTLAAAAVAVTTLTIPATAAAQTPLQARYEHAYQQVAHQFGHRAPGRNIVRYGLPNHKPATPRLILRSLAVLHRMLAPPAAAVSYTPAPASTTQPAAAFSGSSGYTIPSSIVQCESGGNWSAVNPSSGAGGAYQILPSTWQAYGGTGTPQNASPAEQSTIAAKIWATQGPSAWSC